MNEVNHELTDQELYITHFFEEDQVILRQDWRIHHIQMIFLKRRNRLKAILPILIYETFLLKFLL